MFVGEALYRFDVGRIGALQPFVQPRLIGAQFLSDIFETRRRVGAVLFRAVQPRHQSGDGFIDAADDLRGAALRRLDAGGQRVQRLADAEDLISGVGRWLSTAKGRARQGLAPVDRRLGRHDRIVGQAVLEDHLIEPFAQRHTGPPGEVLGGFTRLRIDALYAPRLPRHHPNRFL